MSRIVKISMSVLPLHCNTLILNNKGYPIFHPRILQYSYEHVNTKLDEFQFTEENNQVTKFVCPSSHPNSAF